MKLFFILILFASFTYASFDELVLQTRDAIGQEISFPSRNDYNADIKGKKFEFDIINRQVNGSGDIELIYENMITNSDKIIYNTVSKKIFIEGNTVFKRDQIVLKSDRAEVVLPNYVDAFGDVNLDFKTYKSSSQSANFNFQKQEISLYDNVEFVDQSNNDTFKSNKLIFNLLTEEVLSVGKSRVRINTTRLDQ